MIYILWDIALNIYILKKKKCICNTKSIEFLGHILFPNGIVPLYKYADAIKSFRKLKTVSEVQSFLRLVNYIGKRIADLAILAEPVEEYSYMNLKKYANATPLWQSEQINTFPDLVK